MLSGDVRFGLKTLSIVRRQCHGGLTAGVAGQGDVATCGLDNQILLGLGAVVGWYLLGDNDQCK